MNGYAVGPGFWRGEFVNFRAASPLLGLWLLFAMVPACAGQAEVAAPALPDAPLPQASALASAPEAKPCAPEAIGQGAAPCLPRPQTNWFERFLTGPEVKPLTPAEKARLAVRNVVDPFNVITVVAGSAISVGSDANSPYGPGMAGFARNLGVSFTQDITGEFFSTFLIPSITHQDPHYHRMPNASIPRRVRHAITQVVWTQGDNGRGMFNYADVVGAAVQDEVNNLYVPGRETNLPASATRYGIGLASAPIDNFVSEFLPDLARHIHVQVLVIQRIINQVAKADGPGPP